MLTMTGQKKSFCHYINHICDAACQHFQQKYSLWCFRHIIYIMDFKKPNCLELELRA